LWLLTIDITLSGYLNYVSILHRALPCAIDESPFRAEKFVSF
jgi:hypothetical protein